MKNWIIFFCLLVYSSTHGQNSNPLAMNGYIGYQQSTLNLGHKDFEQVGVCNGLDSQFGGMSWNFLRGQVRPVGADSTVGSNNFFIFKIGYRIGKDFRVGNNSMTSFGIKPFVHIFGSYASMPNKNLNNGKVASAGLVLAPGVELKLSHAYVVARYDAGLYLNTAFWGGNRNHNLARGFIGGLTFSVGVDNAFDLLTPRQFSMRGYNIQRETWTTESGLKYDNNNKEYYREIVTHTLTKYTPGQRALLVVDPYWGIGPSYTFSPTLVEQDPSSMIGFNVGTRFWELMIDGYYEQGRMGLNSPVDYKDVLLTYPVLRDYSFASSITAKNFGGRIGLNLLKILVVKMNFQPIENSKKAVRWKTSYTRFHVFLQAGKTTFSDDLTYRFSDAGNRLDQVLASRGESSNASNNPIFIPKNTTYIGWGANLEIGSVFFNWSKLKYKDAPVADHSVYTVGANIPLGRFFRSQRIRFRKPTTN